MYLKHHPVICNKDLFTSRKLYVTLCPEQRELRYLILYFYHLLQLYTTEVLHVLVNTCLSLFEVNTNLLKGFFYIDHQSKASSFFLQIRDVHTNKMARLTDTESIGQTLVLYLLQWCIKHDLEKETNENESI